MATPQRQPDEEEDEMDLIKILLPDNHGNGLTVRLANGVERQQVLQQYDLPSIKSMVVIRQLPSQGLSFQLWPAANTLVSLLEQHHRQPENSPLSQTLAAFSKSGGGHLKVLELGSGTGLVGIAAAAILGANVTVTDLPHVITNLQFNVDANAGLLTLHGGTVHVAALRWGDTGDVEAVGREFDIVVASDVVYHEHLFEPLLQTLRLLMGLDEKMVFVMAHLRRWKKDSVFFKRARKLFDVEVIHVDKPQVGSRIGVAVYRFLLKGSKVVVVDKK
ncbi:hypothetical protein K2173_006217 [Erythroxylum novogranatense]|uniref:Uncharacterized protein n=1 Tax=Erythroxylum novogranatense TaxID=1862640 RepID=A0AAV8TCL2_9ROSI|nr:hypothetical protein K2173_006217 [Erythroxylum novogranatense]